MNRLWNIGGALALATVAVLAAAGAYYEIFAVFTNYDDEGGIMLCVRHVLDGHRLYDEVHAYYGPFYFLVKSIIHGWFGVPLTHDAVRLTATALRLLAAGLAAGVVFGATRHIAFSGLGFLLVTAHLHIVRYEPGHPQELVAVLLMALPIAALAIDAGRVAVGVPALGVLVAATATTKINVGAFTAIAVWMAILASIPARRLITVLWCASAVAAAALPLILMHAHLAEPWCAQFAGCAAAWIITVAVLSLPRRDGRLAPPHIAILASAGAAGVLLLFAPVFARGTSPAAVVERLLAGPSMIATFFVFPFVAGREIVAAALAGVVLASLAAWMSNRMEHHPRAVHAIGLAKLVFGVATIVVRLWWPYAPWLIGLLAPFAWLVLLPSESRTWTGERPLVRLLLGWLAVIEPLQAYPVAGSQSWVGSLVLMVCAVVCLGDAVDWAIGLLPTSIRRPARVLAATSVLCVAIALAVSRLRPAEIDYRSQMPLALPGATRVRLPRLKVYVLRKLVETINDRCHPFFAFPSFNSLYFWTGQQPPTLDVIFHRMELIGHERQDAIVRALADSPRACLIQQQRGLPPDVHFQRQIDALFGTEPEAHGNAIHVGKYRVLTRSPDGDVSAVPLTAPTQ